MGICHRVAVLGPRCVCGRRESGDRFLVWCCWCASPRGAVDSVQRARQCRTQKSRRPAGRHSAPIVSASWPLFRSDSVVDPEGRLASDEARYAIEGRVGCACCCERPEPCGARHSPRTPVVACVANLSGEALTKAEALVRGGRNLQALLTPFLTE